MQPAADWWRATRSHSARTRSTARRRTAARLWRAPVTPRRPNHGEREDQKRHLNDFIVALPRARYGFHAISGARGGQPRGQARRAPGPSDDCAVGSAAKTCGNTTRPVRTGSSSPRRCPHRRAGRQATRAVHQPATAVSQPAPSHAGGAIARIIERLRRSRTHDPLKRPSSDHNASRSPPTRPRAPDGSQRDTYSGDVRSST